MSSESNGHRRDDPRARELRDADPVTERDPETQRSDVAEETEDQANQPGRLAGTLLMFRDIWRLIRGEDQRGAQGALDAGPAAAVPAQGGADAGGACRRDGRRAGPSLPGRARRSTTGSTPATPAR